MANIDIARHLISSISGQDNYLTVNRIFVQFMGSLEGGIFLQQLIFWSDKTQSVDGFFYKSYVEWEEEICLSEYSIRKQTKILKDKKLLETKLKKANGSPTVHYKLDITGFLKILESFLKNFRMETEKFQNESLNISVSSYTEEYNRRIQQKTTTEETQSSLSSEIFKLIEQNNIAALTEYVAEEISFLINDTSEELVLKAVQIAVENNVRNLRYIKTIIRNWKNEGYRTIDQMENGEKRNGKHQNTHAVAREYDDGVNF